MIAIMDWEGTCIFNVKIWYNSYKKKVGYFNIFKLLCFYTDIICYVYFCFGFSLFFVVFFRFPPIQLMHDIMADWVKIEKEERGRGLKF